MVVPGFRGSPSKGVAFQIELDNAKKMKNPSLKLLIAEDTPEVAEAVAFGARMNWPNCQVTVATTGEEALRSFEQDLRGGG